jgi:four helix bundle protein
MYKFLTKDQKEFILSKQVLRSDTSIGANVNEANSAESKNDFIHKMVISLKESRETLYRFNLLHDSDFIEKDAFESIHKDCIELKKNILSSIILSAKEKKNNSTL